MSEINPIVLSSITTMLSLWAFVGGFAFHTLGYHVKLIKFIRQRTLGSKC